MHLPIDVDDGAHVVDRCSSCGVRLGWRTIDDASRCADYRTTASDHMRAAVDPADYDCRAPGAGANDAPRRSDDRTLAELRPLAALIDPRPAVHEPVRAALHPDLREEDRGIVFYLGLKLGRAVALGGTGARLRRAAAAPFEEAIESLRIGSAILNGWPGSVADHIREKALVDPEAALATVTAVRRVCHGESAWPEHRELVTKAMPEIVEGHHQHVIRRLVPNLVDGHRAARTIGIRGSGMATLVRAKALLPQVARGTARTHGSFLVSDVEAVAAAVADSVEATCIVEEIGITLHGVEQLVCGGDLTPADHRAVVGLYPNLRVTMSSYAALTARLRDPELGKAQVDGGVPLRRTILAVGGREKPWGAIIRAMLAGDLPFAIARPAGRLVDRIDVEPGPGLDAALALVFDRAAHPDFRFAETMRQRDAIELLNIDPSRYQDIAKLLPDKVFGPKKTIVTSAVRELAAELIDAREARHRWGISLDRRRMLPDGPGWRRSDIEAEMGGSRPPPQGSFGF